MNSFIRLSESQKDIFFKVKNINYRIHQEQLSLKRLVNKKDFLSRYNIAIRYMYLRVLLCNYDINSNKVHTAFLLYCSQELGREEISLKNIIKARHELKYYAKQPQNLVMQELDELVLQLEIKIPCEV
jgi:hypothetical protein